MHRRVVICGDESFDSIESYRFDNIFKPPSQILVEYFLTIHNGESTRFARVESSRQQESRPVLFEIEINAQIRAAYFLGVLQIDIRYDGLSFAVTSHSIRQHLRPPFTDTCVIFSKCLENRHSVWRVVICCDESFDSSRIGSIRQHLQSPFTDTCGIFSKRLANRHPEWRVVICCDESFDSSRFDNIFNPLSQTLAEYLLSLLQIDFRYAFPCHKRWFLRPPVSQHHLAANRHSVRRFFNCLWRFAVVWVYRTTFPSWPENYIRSLIKTNWFHGLSVHKNQHLKVFDKDHTNVQSTGLWLHL